MKLSWAYLWVALMAMAIDGGSLPHAAASGDAQVQTEDTVVRFSVGHDAPMIVSLGAPREQSWTAPCPESHLPNLIEVLGKEQRADWQFLQMEKKDRSISFHYESSRLRLKAVSTWSGVAGPGPVEHEVTVWNDGDSAVTFAFAPTIVLDVTPPQNHKLEHWWVQKGAGYPSEDGGTFSKQIEPGYSRAQHSGPYSEDDASRDAIPWFAIQDTDGLQGLYGGIEFSGWTEIGVTRSRTSQVSLTMGMQIRENAGRTHLKPGGSYRYPTCFVGAYRGDVDDGCNRLHRWVESHLRPPMPGGVTPLLVNNSWGSGMAVDEKLAHDMIDDCAELGIEIFQLDAGWYKDVGNWHADPAKFPKGIAEVAGYAHSKGLKFGMWLAWTQGGSLQGADSKVLSVFNPSQQKWFGRDMPADWKNDEFIGEPVCLGAAEAREWCLSEVRRVVRECKLDLLEHDQDMMLDRCDREGHDHIPGDLVDASRITAESYYEIYDQLRAENPHLIFEDCVNGGRLVDFGVTKRVHYICATDVYDPLACRRAFYDSSYPLPPSMVEVYLEHKPGETLASFTSMLRSALQGWATIMIDTSRWTPEQRQIAKREFAIYKERLRPYIAGANLYHILPRPDGKRWDGIQYHDPTANTGVVYVFRANSEDDSQTIKLRGLDAAADYAIESVDGSAANGTRTGKELMEIGLKVYIADEDGSNLLFLSAAN